MKTVPSVEPGRSWSSRQCGASEEDNVMGELC